MTVRPLNFDETDMITKLMKEPGIHLFSRSVTLSFIESRQENLTDPGIREVIDNLAFELARHGGEIHQLNQIWDVDDVMHRCNLIRGVLYPRLVTIVMFCAGQAITQQNFDHFRVNSLSFAQKSEHDLYKKNPQLDFIASQNGIVGYKRFYATAIALGTLISMIPDILQEDIDLKPYLYLALGNTYAYIPDHIRRIRAENGYDVMRLVDYDRKNGVVTLQVPDYEVSYMWKIASALCHDFSNLDQSVHCLNLDSCIETRDRLHTLDQEIDEFLPKQDD